jgi:peroxiredoxin
LQQSLIAMLLPFLLIANYLWSGAISAPAVWATPPAVGDKAPDFSLATVTGKKLKLSDLTAKSSVALIVLRGYPGYQCPYCNLQVQDFLKKAEAFAAAGVQVVLVYPGPPDNLNTRANEFLAEKKLPDHFNLLVSKVHGGRTNAAEILDALAKKKAG